MDRHAADRIKRLREGITFLRRMIKEKDGDEEICNILAKDLDTGLDDSQVAYLERLLSELNAENHLHVVLLYLNFNSRKYFHHWSEILSRKLDTDDSNTEKLGRLLLEQKMINQLPCEFKIGYTEKYPPLKQMITEWIAEEIYFLERSRQLSLAIQSSEGEFAKQGFKLEFDMSVSQFAFLIKAFINIGIIQNKNINEVIRFLSRFIKTKRSENISYESFRTKYFNVESSTKNAVKNTFHSAIGYINRN